jgi:hypothetical protein
MSQADPNLLGADSRFGALPSWATTPYQIGTAPTSYPTPGVNTSIGLPGGGGGGLGGLGGGAAGGGTGGGGQGGGYGGGTPVAVPGGTIVIPPGTVPSMARPITHLTPGFADMSMPEIAAKYGYNFIPGALAPGLNAQQLQQQRPSFQQQPIGGLGGLGGMPFGMAPRAPAPPAPAPAPAATQTAAAQRAAAQRAAANRYNRW